MAFVRDCVATARSGRRFVASALPSCAMTLAHTPGLRGLGPERMPNAERRIRRSNADALTADHRPVQQDGGNDLHHLWRSADSSGSALR